MHPGTYLLGNHLYSSLSLRVNDGSGHCSHFINCSEAFSIKSIILVTKKTILVLQYDAPH